MSTTATQPKSCRSSLRIRRQEWWWKKWFMMEQTAIAGFLRQFFHLLPLRHRLTQEPQQLQLQPQLQPQLRTQQQNIHRRHPPHPPLLHPHPQRQQQRQQQQQQQGTQRAQEEGRRRLQGPQGPEEQVLQTMPEQPRSSGRRQRQDKLQYSSTLQIFLPLDHLVKLKTSLMSRTGAQNQS